MPRPGDGNNSSSTRTNNSPIQGDIIIYLKDIMKKKLLINILNMFNGLDHSFLVKTLHPIA